MLNMPEESGRADVRDTPREVLEQEYLFMVNCLALIVNKAGGEIVITKNYLEDTPRDVRLCYQQNVNRDIVLTVRSASEF